MENFSFCNPTQIEFGKDKRKIRISLLIWITTLEIKKKKLKVVIKILLI